MLLYVFRLKKMFASLNGIQNVAFRIYKGT